MDRQIPRRTFNKGAAATATGLSVAKLAGAAAANERVRLGFIGVANRGGQLLDAFMPHRDAQVVALADVDEVTLARAQEKVGGKVDTYGDFRKLLERKDLDAVVIATPDHWHALQTIMACQLGKDVYCEKPLSITVYEGRKMVEAARKYQRIVQVGLHRRSMDIYRQLAKYVQAGEIGKVTVARAYRLSNMFPDGIGKDPGSAPPKTLDWDMWLGPRQERPFNQNIAPYKFRWWQQYSSQMGNWGVHYCDAIRWMLGEKAPVSVCAMGGKFAIDDDRDIPDTMQATFELPGGCLLVFGQFEANGNPAIRTGEIELRGTQGSLYSSTKGYEVVPERGGQFQDRQPRMKPVKVSHRQSNHEATVAHARNFLDCIKSRQQPHCDVEDGHRSTTFAHVANISLAVGVRLNWDPEAERFTNNKQANELLHYQYRAPWKLEV